MIEVSPNEMRRGPTLNTTLTAGPALTAADRCDRCGAQGYVRVTLPTGGTLIFCGHHAKTLQPHLVAKAITIYDPERYMEKRESLG